MSISWWNPEGLSVHAAIESICLAGENAQLLKDMSLPMRRVPIHVIDGGNLRLTMLCSRTYTHTLIFYRSTLTWAAASECPNHTIHTPCVRLTASALTSEWEHQHFGTVWVDVVWRLCMSGTHFGRYKRGIWTRAFKRRQHSHEPTDSNDHASIFLGAYVVAETEKRLHIWIHEYYQLLPFNWIF